MPPTAAITAVQARIAEIQSRVGGGIATSKNSGNAFESTLASVLGGSSTSTSSVADYNASSTGTSGSDVVAAAKKYLGVPYVYGGTDPTKGLDCSSLVQQAYKDMGITLPRVADQQARQGTAVPSLAQAKPGDLVAFGSPVDHIGIYAGNNKMVVAPHRGDVVKIQDVYKTPTAIRRIIPDTASANSTLDLTSLIGASTGQITSSAISSNLHSKYDGLFVQAGAKYGISPNLLAAVAKQESGFNPNAGSGAGAQGLMQIMPGTAKSLGVNALNPVEAVDGAARMLSGLVKKFGSVDLALAGYNAGPGNVEKYNGIPPFKETQNYVKNVLAMARQGGGI